MSFEHICEGTRCEHYAVWDFGYQDCYSCKKIGQSYNVNTYPSDCPNIIEMHKEDPNKVNQEK